jgi:hypothetical protein
MVLDPIGHGVGCVHLPFFKAIALRIACLYQVLFWASNDRLRIGVGELERRKIANLVTAVIFNTEFDLYQASALIIRAHTVALVWQLGRRWDSAPCKRRVANIFGLCAGVRIKPCLELLIVLRLRTKNCD